MISKLQGLHLLHTIRSVLNRVETRLTTMIKAEKNSESITVVFSDVLQSY